jgi:hypothetical protein
MRSDIDGEGNHWPATALDANSPRKMLKMLVGPGGLRVSSNIKPLHWLTSARVAFGKGFSAQWLTKQDTLMALMVFFGSLARRLGVDHL